MDGEVKVTVRGYEVQESVGVTPDELLEVALELQDDIGMRLADLGVTCTHGHVSLEFDGKKADTE
jgi:hypothetical protein